MRDGIRAAGPGDVEDVVRLVRLLAIEMGERSPLEAEFARRFLDTPGNGILLASAAGRAVGMLSYSMRPCLFHAAPSLLVEDLVVEERCRGQGLGRALLEEAVSLAQRSGCAELSVSTELENERAQAFYRGAGLVDASLFLEKHF